MNPMNSQYPYEVDAGDQHEYDDCDVESSMFEDADGHTDEQGTNPTAYTYGYTNQYGQYDTTEAPSSSHPPTKSRESEKDKRKGRTARDDKRKQHKKDLDRVGGVRRDLRFERLRHSASSSRSKANQSWLTLLDTNIHTLDDILQDLKRRGNKSRLTKEEGQTVTDIAKTERPLS